MTQPAGTETTTTRNAAVLIAYQQAAVQIREQITSFLTALWRSLGTYREPQMAQFTKQAVPVIEGAMAHMQAVTAAYLSSVTHANGGSAVPIAVKPVRVSDVRSGTSAADVYSRPFHLVWRDLAAAQQQKDAHHNWTGPTPAAPAQPPLPPADYVDKAIQAGLDRAITLAHTDVQLAKTTTAQQVIHHDERATGYRRVLEGEYSCGLCIVAATVLYHKKKLLPIHPGCDCSIEPFYGDLTDDIQPTARVNGQLVSVGALSQAHSAIAERFGKSSAGARFVPGQFKDNEKPLMYRDVLIEHANGEIGPVLAVRGQKFTGPDDL